MDKVLKIGEKEVGFRATALTPRLYRHKMGRDIVRDFSMLQNSFAKAIRAQNCETEEEEREAQLSVLDLTIFENIAYIMAKQYDSTVPDSVDEWLDGFDCFSIYEILPELIALWGLNQQTTAKHKKK